MTDEYNKRADRADGIADQTTDKSLRATLRDAATEYRSKVEAYALFRGNTQLTGAYPTKDEVFRAALLEGIIPALQTADEAHQLPADHHIEKIERTHGS